MDPVRALIEPIWAALKERRRGRLEPSAGSFRANPGRF